MAKGKRIRITTLERGEHDDVLRGDAFTMAATLEIMRGLYDDRRWPMTYPGLVGLATVTETPLRGHVLSGLLVRPDAATHLTVDAGSVLVCVPPANGDDSILELVTDPGVSDGATLPFVTNAAGSVRLDIVEVSVTDVVLETAMRGILEIPTRTFDPQSVPKVSSPRLSYRIRQGTAGAGLPAMASGWLPLAVICHQPSTTSFANCDMWDVRPLVADLVRDSDRILGPNGSTVRAVRSSVRGVAGTQGATSGAENGIRGHVDGAFNGYRAGGELRGSVSVSAANFAAADYNGDFVFGGSYMRAVGYSEAADQPVFLAAVFPGGLPRWVLYTRTADAVAGARVPRGPRGILLSATQQPDAVGYYSGLTPPVVSGFTAAAPGIALLAQMGGSGGMAMRGDRTTSNAASTIGGKTGDGTAAVTWTFDTAEAGYPKHATELLVEIDITIASGLDAGAITVEHKVGVEVFRYPITVESTTNKIQIWIPLWTGEVDGGEAGKTILKYVGGTATTASVAKVVGWATP